MKTLQDYEAEEILELLRELKYRHEEDDDLSEQIDSIVDLLERDSE